ncbi:MAG TPA: DUF1684 domain-containing protein [Jatrophihabitans sp.]|jgi:hypothetical protein
MVTAPFELTDWRRRVAQLYAQVRAETDPAQAHAAWRAGRDALFRSHPQSPLAPDDPLRGTGLPYWPYDPALRFTVSLEPAPTATLAVPTSSDGTITLERVGLVRLLGATLDVWWLAQYAGGIFVPLRDGTAGSESYGGGRYLLDTAKGADLGTSGDDLVIDLNFAYHPSCRYNPRWECPLAPEGNRIDVPVTAGERLA